MTRKHFRFLMILLLSGLASLMLVACSADAPTPGNEEAGEEITQTSDAETESEPESAAGDEEGEAADLVVWMLGNSGPGIENALPGFQEQYPNVNIDLQTFGWNDLLPKLQATLTARSGAPDVVEVFSNQIPSFIESGAFVALNDRIEPHENDLASYAYLDSVDGDGNIYSIVWNISPMLLFYRSDIYEAEGVDPASLHTWEQYIEAGEQVTHDEQFMFLTASQSTQPQYFNYFTGMLSQLHGSPFDASGNITINEGDRALRVLQMMEAIDRAEISMDVDAWWTPAFEAAIKSGNLASFVSGAFHFSILPQVDPESEGLWRVQLAPTFEDGAATGVFTGGGRGLMIPSQSQNQDAAWSFIEYMMLNEEGVQATWEGGAILPVYKPAFDAAYFSEPDPYFGGQQTGQIMVDGLRALDGHQWFSGMIPSGIMANEIVGAQLRALMIDEIDAETALENILADMEANQP